ncbi:hypothetical protein theurythT_14300 [Thalassotalea eurytherma]|uniref:Uncharacterized protein n=1 Tax=Thalassotalea eurytherma TaxID=1144278 RepID=A0ABQ6H1A7_9GAMM|nr:hypothetical protein theurythT_14300 [Thalassotalea eurytherma]
MRDQQSLVGCGQAIQERAQKIVRPVEFFAVTSVSRPYIKNFPALVAPQDESNLAFCVGG